MTKVYAKDIDSPFEKGFPKNTFNSEKINFEISQIRLTKTFHFRDIHFSLKKLMKFCHSFSP